MTDEMEGVLSLPGAMRTVHLVCSMAPCPEQFMSHVSRLCVAILAIYLVSGGINFISIDGRISSSGIHLVSWIPASFGRLLDGVAFGGSGGETGLVELLTAAGAF